MRVLKGEELKTIYPKLFEKIFGFKFETQIPRVVITTDQEEVRGFISGYLLDSETFYMAWAGHLDGFKSVRKSFKEMELEMLNAGVHYFVSRIENTNAVTQRLLLGLGWFPRGMSVSNGQLFVEYYKELLDGTV